MSTFTREELLNWWAERTDLEKSYLWVNFEALPDAHDGKNFLQQLRDCLKDLPKPTIAQLQTIAEMEELYLNATDSFDLDDLSLDLGWDEEDELDLDEETADDEQDDAPVLLSDLSWLAKMPNLRELYLNEQTEIQSLNALAACPNLCVIYANNSGVTQADALSKLPQLCELHLNNAPLQTLRLAQSPDLHILSLSGCASLSELHIAAPLVLQELNIEGCEALTAVHFGTAPSELRNLNATDSALTVLPPLAACPQLEELYISNCREIADLSGLNMNNLRVLQAQAVAVADWSLLAKGNSLRTLDLSFCPIGNAQHIYAHRDLEVLWLEDCGLTTLDATKFPKLTTLNCIGNQLTSLDLSACTQLAEFSCSRNALTELRGLARCTQLRNLDCDENQLQELDGAAALPHLESINCGMNALTRLPAFADSVPLNSLRLTSNNVADLRPLARLQNLTELVCSSNPLKSLQGAPLAALEILECSEAGLTSLAGLEGAQALQYVNCSNNAISDLAPLATCPNLAHLDCATTNVSSLRPLFGLENFAHLSYRNSPITDEELATLAQHLPACEMEGW